MNYNSYLETTAISMDIFGIDVFTASERLKKLFPDKSLEQIVDDLIDFRSNN